MNDMEEQQVINRKQYELYLITTMVRALLNDKYLIVEHLFEDSHKNYKKQWLDYDGLTFWCLLDADNKRKTLDFIMDLHHATVYDDKDRT